MGEPDPSRDRADSKANPVLVEVTRGDVVESRHRGAAAVVDAAGATVAAWGDVARAVYPRSAVKPLQAMALVESGAAAAHGVGDEELALACASHNGEPAHVAVAGAWLARLGLGPDDLECGAHSPLCAEAAAALIRAGEAPSPLHNNCSGKHAGMLTLALHMGVPTRGYVRPDHPVQVCIREMLGAMTGVDHGAVPCGVDGCSVPTYAAPLAAIAGAMARFAKPDGLPDARAKAARQLARAMMAHPFMVAGSGRFCTAVIAAGRGGVLVKTGAEGVFAAALPARGLGLAVKIDDGAGRAAEVATAALLRYLGALDDAAWAELAPLAAPRIINRAGRETGVIRAAADWPG